jgi:hypothetical protein
VDDPRILNEHDLYRRLHRNYVKRRKDGKLQVRAGAFLNSSPKPNDPPGTITGMSTQWSEYCTAERVIALSDRPDLNGCLTLDVGGVRDIPDQQLCYSPTLCDPGHVDVFGDKSDPEIRTRYLRLAEARPIIWPPEFE